MHIQQFWKYISILLTSACLICFCSCEKPAKKKKMKIWMSWYNIQKTYASSDVVLTAELLKIEFRGTVDPQKKIFSHILTFKVDKFLKGKFLFRRKGKSVVTFGRLLTKSSYLPKLGEKTILFVHYPKKIVDGKQVYTKFISLTAVLPATPRILGIIEEYEDEYEKLIQNLGVDDKGNHTCNTASALLITRKDEAVPYLDSALSSPNKKIRTRAVNVLGSINTKKSRAVLIRAYPKLDEDLRGYIAYILAFWPNKDAEAVYIRALSQKNPWHYQVCIIRAMGEVKSREALPNLREIIAKPNGWDEYYTALCSVRKIKGKELPPKLSEALELLKKAKYNASVNKEQLKSSGKVIMANINLVLPDLLNIYLYVTKGNITDFDPNAKTLLRDAGEAAYPYFAIALKNSSHEYLMNSLIKELGIEDKFKRKLYPQSAIQQNSLK
jgi:HEAT repeat protein